MAVKRNPVRIIRDRTSSLVPIDGGKRYRNKHTGKVVSKRQYQKRSLFERTGLKLSNEEAARRHLQSTTAGVERLPYKSTGSGERRA